MKDKNTKQRKQMIKEMKKNTFSMCGKETFEAGFFCLCTRPKGHTGACKSRGGMLLPNLAIKKWNHPTKGLLFNEDKELNFLQAFIILVITLVLFTVIFPLLQRALDIQALNNCELRGDCSEVIRDINNK